MELGFLEEAENSWKLQRCYFPSKVGGKPAWLDPEHLPGGEQMLCCICSKPLIFLLQLYAPNDDKIESFHRTIFVFCCRNGGCYSDMTKDSPFRVFRSLLSQENKYYPNEAPDYNNPDALSECHLFTNLCEVCGNHGTKLCSRCKKVQYCSKHHQVLHWKSHKHQCNVNTDEILEFNSPLFPEKEIVIETEPPEKKPDNPDLDQLNEMHAVQDFSDDDLQAAVADITEDKAFSKFHERISREPDQVIRYGKKVLWCSADNIPSEIPPCICGAQRTFMFQVMPQLLNHLKIEHSVTKLTIDWGTVAVYTCQDDCNTSPYIEEYAWKQNVSSTAT
uniref:MYND-type domain-containing protein n=1 Tax=Ciona savignyi TaxID=51511 RepID=H2Z0Z0_CIOSA